MTKLMKWYLLVQLSFWLQQIVVLCLEQSQRRGYYALLVHRIMTYVLISAAYIYRLNHAANVVLCLMEVGDFLLSALKVLT
ncbi:hypothetical protein BDV23DRAFT_155879 [Aspergillus alliaceus]|uniref:TLC domain-containing protein n=1 Tax=Petromyces alliaceus TaxID=209559 RepID=A0A5N7C8I3_PETAA|nr:hypothetical protein BDV23DRAFT_155879 [Aspergillus alliaceus]